MVKVRLPVLPVLPVLLVAVFQLSCLLYVWAAGDQWVDTPVAGVQDLSSNPILKASGMFEWILGDPTILDVELPGGGGRQRYLLANEVFHGVILYRADPKAGEDSTEFAYTKVGSAVPWPGAMRPYAFADGTTVHLFFEQYKLSALYKASDMYHRQGEVQADGTITWGAYKKVLSPELAWEKIGTQRVGNPFVFYHPTEQRYWLYYSASSVHLPDSKVDEPLHFGLASSPTVDGPYVRESNDPMVIRGLEAHPKGMGGLKLVKGIAQDYEAPLAIFNHITDKAGVTGSTISLAVGSDRGRSFDVVTADLIPPSLIPGAWNESYCYGFDTAVSRDDSDHVLIVYNGRNGWKGAVETVGAARITKEALRKAQKDGAASRGLQKL